MQKVREQRTAALAKANAIRTRRAQLKRDLKSGTLELAVALDEPDLQHWTAADLIGFAAIGSVRWKGRTQAQPAGRQALEILSYARIGHNRLVRDLTPLERRLILDKATELQRKRESRRLRLRRSLNGHGPHFLS